MYGHWDQNDDWFSTQLPHQTNHQSSGTWCPLVSTGTCTHMTHINAQKLLCIIKINFENVRPLYYSEHSEHPVQAE